MDSRFSRPTQQDRCAVYYRFVDIRYAAPLDEWDTPIGRGSMKVELLEVPVYRFTRCGAWMEGPNGLPKFVLRSANKQYALPTKEEALASFIARKRRQAKIYRSRLADAEEALALALANRTTGPVPRFCFDRDGEALL